MRRYDVDPEVQRWLDDLSRRGRRDATIESYGEVVMRHLRFLRANGYLADAASIGIEEIGFLYANLPGKESTRRSELRQLANFILFTTGRDPVKQVGLLYNRESIDRVWIDLDDFKRMMAAADPTQRVILILGGMMGLRRSEIASLRDGDIDGNRMTVRGKGHGRDGLVSVMEMPPPVTKELDRYFRWREPYRRADDHVVQHLFVTYGELRDISPKYVSDSVRKLGLKAGVRATSHSLRRMYGTALYYECGCDPATLKDLLRHASINTTFKCYIGSSEKRKKEVMDALSELMGDRDVPDR
ncbi:MAG: site-specific integrase [Candidatus Methanomethylophilaceae archaeon]|nr:site-specific integrase [Candidatus Methanomethylophilaceae archaeon]